MSKTPLPIRDETPLNGFEQVLVTKINWAIGRQNVTVALLLSTLIGTITLSRLGGSGAPIILVILIVAIILEFWAIFNFEEAIIFYQFTLTEIRLDWKIRDDSLIWWWFKANGKIDLTRFARATPR